MQVYFILTPVCLTRLMALHVSADVVKMRYDVWWVRKGQIKGEYSGHVLKGRIAVVTSLNGMTDHINRRALLLHDPIYRTKMIQPMESASRSVLYA